MFLGNLIPGIKLKSKYTCLAFLPLKSKIKPNFAHSDQILSLFRTIITNLTEKTANNAILTKKYIIEKIEIG